MSHYAILGLGGIGATCAVKLHQAGHDVHCLVTETSHAHLQEHGFELETAEDTIRAILPVYKNIEEMPACDYLLVALKTTDNNVLLSLLPKIKNTTMIVVNLQNGIGIEQEINQIIPAERIIGANCFFRGIKTGPGKIKYISYKGFNNIKFAQYYSDPTQSGSNEHVKQLAHDLTQAGFDATAEDSLTTVRWSKLINNIPVNGLTVVLNGCIQDIVKQAQSWDLFCHILDEVTTTGQKCGADVSQKDYERNKELVSNTINIPDKIYPSSKSDYDNHRPMEIQAIFKNAIDIAAENGIDMPLTNMLYQILAFMDEKNT